MIEYLGLPINAASHGLMIDNMISWVHWVMLILFVGWGIYLIIAVIKFNAKSNPQADYHGVQSHFSHYIEYGVLIIEAFLLIGLSIPLYAQLKTTLPNETDVHHIRIIAQQFAWNIHYPGVDGKFGKTDISLVDEESNPIGLDRKSPFGADDLVTINQMHLPVNRQVMIHLSSKDVIHSFGIPEMRVKQDAIPGMTIPFFFTPTITTDEFFAICNKKLMNNYSFRGGEPFTDLGNNKWDEDEEFIDCNSTGSICEHDPDWSSDLGNRKWNEGEKFTDLGNGKWDEGEKFVDFIIYNMTYDEWDEYEDINRNGKYDYSETCDEEFKSVTFMGNLICTNLEEFSDTNNNGKWDEGEKFTDNNDNGKWDLGFNDANGNGTWDPAEPFIDKENGKWDVPKGYEIACAQLCGNAHYRMRGFVTVETVEEFNAWLEEEAEYLEEEDEDDDW